MKKETITVTSSKSGPTRPLMSPEAQENHMVSLAMNLAEKQLRDGTASAQVISHFLKIGSTKDRMEKEILELQKDLIVAKTETLHAQQNMDEMYKKAIDAMRSYTPNLDADETDDLNEN